MSGALTILLRQGGVDVTHLQPGPYRFTINDASTQHNFRLTGPGIEERTPIETMVNVTWDLDLSSGLYHYNCEHHAQMFGDFTVGDVLWVEAMGSGMGKVTSAPAGVNWPWNRGAAFPAGSEVTLTATPNSGSKFLGWSGACSGTAECTVTVNGRVEVRASFGTSVGGGGAGGGRRRRPRRSPASSSRRRRRRGSSA